MVNPEMMNLAMEPMVCVVALYNWSHKWMPFTSNFNRCAAVQDDSGSGLQAFVLHDNHFLFTVTHNAC